MGIIGYILCLDEEVDRVIISDMKIYRVCFCILYEKIDFSFSKKIKCDTVMLGRVIVGVHEVIVGLDDTFPFR